MLSFKPTFSLSSFTFIKRLFSSSSLSAIRVVLPLPNSILLSRLFLTWQVTWSLLNIPLVCFLQTYTSVLPKRTRCWDLHFILYLSCLLHIPVCATESVSHSVLPNVLRPQRLQPARLLWQWNSPGKNTGVGSHSLLQGILSAQGLNLSLLYCRWILHHLSHQRTPIAVCTLLKKIRLG